MLRIQQLKGFMKNICLLNYTNGILSVYLLGSINKVIMLITAKTSDISPVV